jgi:hypothetical protein
MTDKEVQNHLAKLLNKKKISLDKFNKYQYEFIFDDLIIQKGIANFQIDYYNGKLYKFKLSIEPIVLYKASIPISNLQLKLIMIYGAKYGFSTVERQSDYSDVNDHLWIDGNRMIRIYSAFDEAIIIYTDLIAEREKRDEVNEENFEKTNSIIHDI